MIHILAYADGQITVVVDSAQTEEVRNLIGSIRKAIWSMSIQLMPLEMAA
jgi:nitrate reductase NapAB chaperone NapD